MTADALDTVFLGNSILAYVLALAILIVGFIGVRILKFIFKRGIKRWAKLRNATVDGSLIRLVENAIAPALYIGVFYVAIANLDLHPILQQVVRVLAVVAVTYVGVQLVCDVAEYFLRLYLLKKDNPNLEQSLEAFVPAIRVLVWAVGIIFLLDNLGLDISALVASLGIGGVAIALASQGLLQDLFSYFSILFDRPFEIGDFIMVDGLLGTVEHVGIKTTRLTSLNGEELVLANTDLTSSRLHNFKNMERRRAVFNIGVTYDTTASQLEAIPGIVEEIVNTVDGVVFDRAHFTEYGDFSLNFEVVYTVTTPDYGVYMDAQQRINLALFKAFEERGIEFAYPTNVTYLENAASENGSGSPKAAIAGKTN